MREAGAFSRVRRAMCNERVAVCNGALFVGRREKREEQGEREEREHERPARKKRLTIRR